MRTQQVVFSNISMFVYDTTLPDIIINKLFVEGVTPVFQTRIGNLSFIFLIIKSTITRHSLSSSFPLFHLSVKLRQLLLSWKTTLSFSDPRYCLTWDLDFKLNQSLLESFRFWRILAFFRYILKFADFPLKHLSYLNLRYH